jgi:membrane protein
MTEGAHPGGPGTPDSNEEETLSLLARVPLAWDWLQRELWADDPNAPVVLRGLRSAAQLITLTIKGFEDDQLLLRASALTYVTALSIIPMLAVVIAVLGLVGGDETIVNFAIDQLTTVAPSARETVRGYAAHLDFASFGKVGGAIVFGTAVFALRHLETTLNEIWGVASSRGWARRFADYLAVMVVAPISVGVAVSLATTLQSEPVVTRLLEQAAFARIYGFGLSLVPLMVLSVGFTFLYWFFPNTKVRIRAAAFGGFVAAVLFSTARGIYVDFQVGASTYQAVFGALSAVPLILAWLYVCWAIVLLGSEVAFAAQNLPYARREMRSGEASPAQREAIVIEIAVEIVRNFRDGEAPPTAEWLADLIDEPVRLVRRLIEQLEQADLVRGVVLHADRDVAYVPARPLNRMTVGETVRAVRGEAAGGNAKMTASGASNASNASSAPVAEALERLRDVWSEVADQTSLESLARREAAATSGEVA